MSFFLKKAKKTNLSMNLLNLEDSESRILIFESFEKNPMNIGQYKDAEFSVFTELDTESFEEKHTKLGWEEWPHGERLACPHHSVNQVLQNAEAKTGDIFEVTKLETVLKKNTTGEKNSDTYHRYKVEKITL